MKILSVSGLVERSCRYATLACRLCCVAISANILFTSVTHFQVVVDLKTLFFLNPQLSQLSEKFTGALKIFNN